MKMSKSIDGLVALCVLLPRCLFFCRSADESWGAVKFVMCDADRVIERDWKKLGNKS
jgi:hypothetical protein